MATVEHAPAGIGASPLRKEDAPLLAGQGRYVDDIKLPGMLHAAFVRSTHASARILSVEIAAAEAMSGVSRVLTAETLGLTGGVPCASNPFGGAIQVRRPILAEGRVRMLGEPIALVIACDRASARDAADRVVGDNHP
ncbi:MAG: aerobic carbon-monoxide dehydrogenase large subunit, partial [Gaiellales bacterium]|nr:aerobic carbon-monoxide dehydrogenase large subunit [Gaiellales bacterium]